MSAINDPVYLPMLASTTDVSDATDFLYPPNVLSDPDACLERAFLSAHKVFVDKFNDVILDRRV